MSDADSPRGSDPRELTDPGGTLPVHAPPPGRPAGRAPQLSLRTRWALSIGVAAALLIALVIYVSGHNSDASQGQPISPKAELEANREATILVEQDQAPHTSPAPRGRSPQVAVAGAVKADLRRRISQGQAGGPVRAARCASRGAVGARRGFDCRVQAAGVYYEYLGVLDAARGTITLCKSDPPPVASETVPVSARCRA